MIFTQAILGQELTLVGVIGAEMGLIYAFLRLRGHLGVLRHVWLPALLWAIFGILDALVTMVGTWGDPWREANSWLRAWLLWDGWVGQLIYTFLYVLIWASVVIGLEALRRRAGGFWPYLLGVAQLLILYRLALEHFYGFLTWTALNQLAWNFIAFFVARTPWLFSDSVVGYVLDFATALAAICVVLHLTIAALLRRLAPPTPVAPPAQARATQPRQIITR
ncbi:MAG: hypothetical protein ACHQ1E_13260 [Ktedonobacterales bacterium]|jgi:hypothetical protein